MDKKNWEPPQTAQDAMLALEELSSLIQFVKDLSIASSSRQDVYQFSAEGYYGFYYFLGIVQDMTEECHKAIHKSFKAEKEGNNHVK